MEMNWNHTLIGAGMPGANTSRYARLQLLAEKENKVANVVAARDDFLAPTWQPVEDDKAPPPNFVDLRCTYEGRGNQGWPPSRYSFNYDPKSEPLHFVFGFWSYAVATDPWTAGIEPSRYPQITSGGSTPAKAQAWYVRSFPPGGGDEQAFLDACYISPDNGELTFIPDDFVTVTPDDAARDLTKKANSGSIDTSKLSSPVAVAAATQIDSVSQGRVAGTDSPDDPGAMPHPKLKFSHWLRAALLSDSLGSMDSISGDLTVAPGADLYAWAVYDTVPVPWRLPDPDYSDAIFLFEGSDGPVSVVHISDLLNGHWHPHPVPDPGFVALVKNEFSTRIVPWTNSRTPNSRDRSRLRELARNAQHTHDNLMEFLNTVGRR